MANPDPFYEAITQQIAYLMSAITNQNMNKTNGQNGPKQNNSDGKFSSAKTKKFKKDRKDMKCWGCGGMGHRWRECSTPRQGNNLHFKPTNPNQNTSQNLNGCQGEEIQASSPLPAQTREESTSMDN